jgi:hypothetical protein
MDMEIITNDVVRNALQALNDRDRETFEKLLAANATMIHNSGPDDIRRWAAEFFFGEGETRFKSITKTADHGQTIWADLESSIAGAIAVKLAFSVDEGKIVSLNAGRP